MKTLVENGGIPRTILFVMAILAGLTVANMYYNQPLLEMMHSDLHISMIEANLITVITQAGYACGLFFVIPAGDLCNRRHIAVVCMSLAAVMLLSVQYHQLSGQSGSIALMPSASSRVSAIFMTIFFIGGSLGTFLAGLGWNHLGWTGVSLTGFLMATVALLITLVSGK